jgi:hypothetical protein
MTFEQMFRDQRWADRKRSLLQAAGWACQECSAPVEDDGVHVCFYPKGKMVWDYPSKAFKVLCEPHRKERADFERQVRETLPAFATDEIGKLLDLLDEMRVTPPDDRLHVWDELRATVKRERFAERWSDSSLEPLNDDPFRFVPGGRS